MKRIISFLFALALILSLAACAAPAEKADDGTIKKAHYGALFLYNRVPRSYFTLQPNELSIEEKQR